jgi:alpha-ketoglutarate-dependent taurine dioxygenase
MKISKIPGLGRFGVFVDDLDFATISEEEWMNLGKLHLEHLVTIIRNVNIQPHIYEQMMTKWGNQISLAAFRLLKKHNVLNIIDIYKEKKVNGILVDPQDQEWLENAMNVLAIGEAGPATTMARVSGKKDKTGRPLGMFAEGELLWHSNESGNVDFSPGVALLGYENVVGSCTGFLTTTDWYEDQTESFRSELNEMIMCHEFTPGKINPGLRESQDHIMYRNMCPAPTEIPLIINSPAGIRGLHYSTNTINTIKGMTREESDKMFEFINKTLFVDKYMYDHWYQQDNDLLIFDNSITLHRRLGGVSDRLCYRIQFDYANIEPTGVNRYLQEPFASEYTKKINDVRTIIEKCKELYQ